MRKQYYILYRFTGPNCEININECDMNNCQNDATCVDRYLSFDITIFEALGHN